MEGQALPKMLRYKSVKPKGFPSKFRRWDIQPLSTNSVYTTNDVIRFQLQTDSYIDPYSTYVEITVEFPQDNNTLPQQSTITLVNSNGLGVPATNYSDVPVYMLDGPATSMINEMVMYSNNQVVERVEEYDQIGQILYDIGLPSASRNGKSYEGITTQAMYENSFSKISNPVTSHSTFDPSITPAFNGLPSDYQLTPIACNSVSGLGRADLYASIQQLYGPMYAWGSQDMSDPSIDSNSSGYLSYRQLQNFAREYCLNDSTMGIQSTLSRSCLPIEGSSTYAAYSAVTLPAYFNGLNTETNPNPNLQHFYRNPHSQASIHNNSVYWCPGVPAQQVQYGISNSLYAKGGVSHGQNQTTSSLTNGVTSRTLYVPLISGVLGHLIPPKSWKLIPGKGCGLMQWEFRLNRYAIFSSGHQQNIVVGDSPVTVANQHNMDWTVTSVKMHFDLWDFDETVTKQIDQQLEEGIVICSQGFSQGPTYQIANTASVKGLWNINNGVLSLKNLYYWFILNDYTTYNFCRKHFRISHNIKNAQLKIGTEFVPPQPITGCSGNIVTNTQSKDIGDCQKFLMELYRIHGDLFSTKQRCGITPETFTVNERAYSVATAKDSLCQKALWHELRLRGTALYCFDLQADPYDNSVLSGIDTTTVRPIQLQLDVWAGKGDQNRASTMYIACHHDLLVSFTSNGIQTVGQG